MKIAIPALAMAALWPLAHVEAADELSHPGLTRGRRVQVEGRVRADGTIEARRIRLRDPESIGRLEGTVTSISTDLRIIRVGGFDVSTDTNPSVEANVVSGTLLDLTVGSVVEVTGRWSGRVIVAERLRLSAGSSSTDPPQTTIESEIERVGGLTTGFVVLGRRVHLAEQGRVIDERSRDDPLDLSGRRLRREEDDPGGAPLRLGDYLVAGGRIGGDVESERNYSDTDRRDRATASAEVLASLALGRHVELYGTARFGREYDLRDRWDLEGLEGSGRLVEAAVSLDRIAGSPVGVRIGRQRFKDVREWFMDSNLDAATVSVTLRSWRAEMAVAEALFAGPRAERSRREQRHAIASMTWRLGSRATASAIAVARDDRNRDEKPLWIGMALTGRPTSGLRFWANGAVRRGHAGETELRGWGMDGAVSYRLPWARAASINAGYAAASGDGSRSDDVDTTFRQTDLEGNGARFQGLKSFAYYGEVFDPELSNLNVLTAGIGIEPFDGASIDVVYHHYRQREAGRLPSNALDATGTGTATDLGQEVDVVIALQRFRPLDISVVAGMFWPGPGVTMPQGPSRYWRPQIRFFF